MGKEYSQKLKDPRWQRKRLEIFQRDNWSCSVCGDKDTTLHVHHKKYIGEPWECPDNYLETLCEDCHSFSHKDKNELKLLMEFGFTKEYVFNNYRFITSKGKLISKLPYKEPEKPLVEKEECKKRISGLSLSSLNYRKQHEINKENKIRNSSGLSLSSLKAGIDEPANKKKMFNDLDNLPYDDFTESDLQRYWVDYAEQLDKKGKKIMAANLRCSSPRLGEFFTIDYETPNKCMKEEIKTEQGPLIEYLKEKLNNDIITLKITVNHEKK